MFDLPAIEAISDILRQAGSRHIMPRFRALDSAEIAVKSGHDDLVTEADIRAERHVSAALSALWPDALVVGEEAIAADPGLRDQIPKAPLAFIIDPVDGTWNFAKGLATFGTILAATRHGQPVLGMLYDPVFDDCILATGEDGNANPAVFRRADGSRSTLRLADDSDSTLGRRKGLSGYLSLPLFPRRLRPAVARVIPQFGRVASLRCSCHELRMLAQGHVDFLLAQQLTPWDHAGGVVVMRAAGGHAEMLDGRRYHAGLRDGYLLFARSRPVWERVAEHFQFLLNKDDPAVLGQAPPG